MAEYTFQCCRCGEIDYGEVNQEIFDKIRDKPLNFICVCCWAELMNDIEYSEQFRIAAN